MCEEACQDLLKSCIAFGGSLGGCNEKKRKNGEGTEGRGSIVKREETLHEVGWDGRGESL